MRSANRSLAAGGCPDARQRFAEVLDGLDEVRLTEDELGRFRLVDRYR